MYWIYVPLNISTTVKCNIFENDLLGKMQILFTFYKRNMKSWFFEN